MNPILLIQRGKEHAVRSLHPWIFSNAFHEPVTPPMPGAIVDIYSSDHKHFVARGYYNPNSSIRVRILTRHLKEEINQEFFEKKIAELKAIRERFINTRETNAYRLVYGESDELPGLIIDKYNDTYVIQLHTLGMDVMRDIIVGALRKVCDPKTIYERSDVGVRVHEGLEDQPKGLLWGKKPAQEIEIKENGVTLLVNVADGQKTGMFLDQRENRKALQKYVVGKRVLNCFSYTGGFSIYAALGGASETVSVDVAGAALETAARNFEINKIPLKNHSFVDADVFKYLEDAIAAREKFDVIILDPPAFVKNAKSMDKGMAGYVFINEKALKLLPEGGILISSSCSSHVTDEMFVKMLLRVAQRANCMLKIIEVNHQPVDHPFNIHFPEGKYLKFYVMVKS
ncbi:class I SAM-dependent rRNA methyltransferase [Candidatus Gracilibacteria bacterium]|nr:class I SAM-dependent rRNA methyltransferase [Candidatus Gracilibacteria bacterium]